MSHNTEAVNELIAACEQLLLQAAYVQLAPPVLARIEAAVQRIRGNGETVPRIWTDILGVLTAAGQPSKRDAIWRRLLATGRPYAMTVVYRQVARMVKAGLLQVGPSGFAPVQEEQP